MPIQLPDFKHSETGGVKPMNIEGRFGELRARLSPEFTDADRAWRKQFLKDQILAHDEPRFVPEHYYGTKNKIRRFYRAPFDALERMMIQKKWFSVEIAMTIRRAAALAVMGYLGGVYVSYWFKYNQNDWTRIGGFRLWKSEPVCLPCHPDYPRKIPDMKPQDYDTYGFKDRKTHLNP